MRLRALPLAIALTACVVRHGTPLDRADPPPHAHDGRIGVHGMIVVGDERVFLSHLPMLAPPHDYQIVLEATLTGASALPASYSDALYTFAPEPFSLDALRQGARPTFDGALFRGNFERGGERIATGVHVEVKRILVARALGHLRGRPSSPRGFLFGTPQSAFLLRAIESPDDRDQLVRVDLREGAPLASDALDVSLGEGAPSRLGVGQEVPYGRVAAEISCLEPPDYTRPCDDAAR